MMTLDRRQFMELTVGATLLCTGFGCASMVTHRVPLADGVVRLDLALYPDLAAAGGSLRVLPAGRDEPLYVLALDEGGYAAVSPICTHRGCTVEVQRAALVCPCHGSTYDRRGTVVEGPAERDLQAYATRLGDDDVLLIRVEG